jgi:hypothetical protein
LPQDSVLQKAPVIRAMLEAISTVREADARRKRRALLPVNVGREWSAEEERQLDTEFQSGTTLAEIAQTHGRTLRAIENRCVRLGLMSSSEMSGQVTKR